MNEQGFKNSSGNRPPEKNIHLNLLKCHITILLIYFISHVYMPQKHCYKEIATQGLTFKQG